MGLKFVDFITIHENKSREILGFPSIHESKYLQKILKLGRSAKFLKPLRFYFLGLVKVLELKNDNRLNVNVENVKCE